MNTNTAKLLDNPGLNALTVPEEQKEIEFVIVNAQPSLTARIRAAEVRRRKIIFAFFQSDFKGGRIPYWHVTIPYHKSYGSTLSMQGLRDWKVL